LAIAKWEGERDDAWSREVLDNPSLVEGFELHNSPVGAGTERTATMER
jgi:hypothetical protein